MTELSEDQIRQHLIESHRIAVVGLSQKPDRPSHRVAAYLQRVGYEIVPVHPVPGVTLGQQVHPNLRSAAAAGPLDIVDIFRRSEYIPALLDDLLAVRPRLVWLQLGIDHPETVRRLEEAGIDVVVNRCLAVDHQWLRA